ncbi:MAG: TetR/AcrR family transcriptional regulator [Deltaproteobacteria bacterium]|nr:MAG: TetR/AcrR family transcriptional regulator [Deltaproteobacteria bacterium]
MPSHGRSQARRSPTRPDALPAILRATREPDFHQDRARRSYLALIDAATALFATRGYDAVGTPEIAQRAGVATGTFYRYFTDKHEIYLEIARRTMVAGYHKTIADLGPERFLGWARHETISETIAILFDHVLSQPELTRSFREMSLRDPEVAELSRAFEQVSVSRIAALISAIVDAAIIPDPEATAWVLHASVTEAAYALAGHRGPPPISPERARKALTDFIERAVFPRP